MNFVDKNTEWTRPLRTKQCVDAVQSRPRSTIGYPRIYG